MTDFLKNVFIISVIFLFFCTDCSFVGISFGSDNFTLNLHDISENIQSPEYEEINSKSQNKNDLFLNTKSLTEEGREEKTFLSKIDNPMLNTIIPENYSVFDSPSRDVAPVNRFNFDVSMNKNLFAQNDDFLSQTLFNALLKNLTNDRVSFSLDLFALKDNPNNIKMNIALKPIRNLIFKFSRFGNKTDTQSVFEMKVHHNNNKNIKFKTTENGKNSSTGIEFEMIF